MRSAFNGLTSLTLTVTLAALAACGRPTENARLAQTRSALFTNGDFESGTLTGWTVTTNFNSGIILPPTSLASLQLGAGGTNRTRVITGPAESVTPQGLSAGSSLRVPRYGSASAVVNELGTGANVNSLLQSMTTTNGDVDPVDNKVHVRFAIAPVLQNPGHGDADQPYFWVQLRNVTKGTMLFSTFNFSNQTGVPWKTDPSTGTLYTDWQAFDISPGPARLAVGDTIEIMVVAAGCSAGGHYGHVYVDAFGPTLPGLAVAATAPQQVNSGATLAYTFNYKNAGQAAGTNVIVEETLPAGTTFASVNAPGATCTTPAVGSAGQVVCNVGTVNPSASGSFTIIANVTAAAGATISNGNYRVYADGVSPLIGPLVTTSVTSNVQYADLGVTLTDGAAALGWGSSTTYTMVATNAGPSAANGATLSLPQPANVASMSWTCTAAGGAACPAASGSGSINAAIAALPSGGSVTWTVAATVATGSGSGTLIAQPTITAPAGVSDNDSTNNVAVDTDQLGTLRTLTLQKAGTGQGTVISSPAAISCGAACTSQSASFLDGTQVAFTATAAPGWVFNGWSGGGCTGVAAGCTVGLVADTTVTADFGPVMWNVTGSAPGGNGTVTCATPVENTAATTCTIAPAARYYLSALTDNATNVLASVASGTYPIASVTANHAVVGTFAASSSTAALGVSPGGSVFGQGVTLTGTLAGIAPAGTPGGTVDFTDGGVAIPGCTGRAVTAGTASCVTGGFAVGTHSLRVVSSGDAAFNGATSPATSYVVSKAAVAVGLTDSPAGASQNGVAVTLGATVAAAPPGAGSPGGTVAFTDDGVTIPGCGAVALAGGSASCTTPAVLGARAHTFAAAYSGDAGFSTGSASLSHLVQRFTPALTLSSAPSLALHGEPVTYAITVAHASGTPTGQVTVLEGATTVCGPVTLAGGAATCTTAGLLPGTHALTVSYAGDGGYLPATGGSASQLVVRSTASIALDGSATRVIVGQSATLTATVQPDAPSALAPTGTITFSDGATVVCSAVAISGGTATCALSGASVGVHALTARYNGSTGYAPSTSNAFAVQVDQASTTVAVTTSPATPVTGQAVTLTATVSKVSPATGTPTGTVVFTSDGAPITGCESLTLTGGVATCTATALGAGSHAISARFAGDATLLGATGSATLAVGPAATATAIAGPAGATTFGAPASFTATVTAVLPGSGTPAGTVTFKDGVLVLGTAALSAGQATFSTSSLRAATHAVTATYEGSAAFLTSTSAAASLVVQRATPAVAATATPVTATVGQAVTLAATVSGPVSGTTPSGTVTFSEGATTYCTATLSAGAASCSTSTIPAGNHTVLATYAGDADHATATANAALQVTRPTPSVDLASNVLPSAFGQPVTFTVSVASGAGTPTGVVTVKEGATTVCGPVTLEAGTASCSTQAFTPGSHPLVATYDGDVTFLPASSAALTQLVVRGTTSSDVTADLARAVWGQPVTIRAVVAPDAPSVVVPIGTLTFLDSSGVICADVPVDGAGVATCTTSSLGIAVHTLSARYSGSNGYAPSTSFAFAVRVDQASTSLALSPNPASTVFGQPVAIRVDTLPVAPGAGTATGTVTVTDGGVAIPGCTGLSLAGGSAVCTVPALEVGTHGFTATYTGDTHFVGSAAAQAFAVARASTDAALAATTPTVFGEAVTLHATIAVRAPGAGVPAGTVTFAADGAALGTASLDGAGHASFTTSALATGTHALVASYSGDGSFEPSASTASEHVVGRATAAAAIAAAPATPVFGEPVALSANLSAVAPGVGLPSGAVTFLDGGVPVTGCVGVALHAGSASCTASGLAVGVHGLSVAYTGDASFEQAASAVASRTVGPAPAALAAVSGPALALFGEPVVVAITASAVAPSLAVPAGIVEVRDGGVLVGTCALQSGACSVTTAALAVGGHALVAMLVANPQFQGAASAPAEQAVQPAATATALASSLPASSFGVEVTFTADVVALAPGAGVPDGTVTFRAGDQVLGSAPLAGGRATLASAALHAGLHPITATYEGSTSFLASGAEPLAQRVDPAATSILLANSSGPSVTGQGVTFVATVTSSAPTPSGTVTFEVGGVVLGSGTLDATGVATFSTGALPVGPNAVVARYGGAADWAAADSAAIVQVVDRAAVEVALTASPQPTIFGQPLALEARVSAVAPGAGFPGGTVIFRDGATIIGTAVVGPDGTATLLIADLAVGDHAFEADYAGDAGFANASSLVVVTHPVNRAPVSVALAPAADPVRFGEAATIAVSVTAASPGAGTPAGAVSLHAGALALGSAELVGGVAVFHVATLPVGVHALHVDYAGDVSFIDGTGAGSLGVVRAASAVAVASSVPSARSGQAVTFTTTVTAVAPGAGTPGGTITFKEGASVLGTGALTGGVATFTTSSLATGTHAVVADYAGDGSFEAATGSLEQVVEKADVRVALAAPAARSGQAVALTATLTAVAPGAGTPSGTVTFKDGAAVLGTGTLSGGVATFSTSSLAVGTHALTAEYGGDASFHGASAAAPVTIEKSDAAVALGSSVQAPVSGQAVTFTATVTAVAPGAGTPTGTVTFKDGAAVLGTGTLSGGSATFSASLPAGAHALSAEYAGDDAFNAAAGPLALTAGKAGAAVALASSATPSRFGQAVTFTATVTAVAPGTGTPGGSITFKEGAAVLGHGTLSAGAVSLTTSGLAVGAHAVIAEYAGDAAFIAESGTAQQAVERGSTTVALVAAPSPAMFGEVPTLTATVAFVAPATGVPAGTVTFRDGEALLGTAQLAGGVAMLEVPHLVSGTHTVTAEYAGNGDATGASGTASLEVRKGTTEVALTTSRPVARRGQPITFTATVTSPHAVPGGEVAFHDGDRMLGTGTLEAGRARITVRDLVRGDHPITAAYDGSADFDRSSGTLAGGQVVENTPPVAGAGTALALGAGHAIFAAGDHPVAAIGALGTAEAWFHASWTTPADAGVAPTVLRLSSAGVDRLVLGVRPDRRALVVALGGLPAELPAALDDGRWHHVALAAAGGEVIAYVDGLPVGTVFGDLGEAPATAIAVGEGFIGELDEVRLWSATRTPAELDATARRPVRADAEGLVALWRFDEATGAELFDAGPAGLDLAPAFAPDANAPTAFTDSTAWRARTTWQGRPMAAADAGYDVDGDPLALSTVAAPAHGHAALDAETLRVDYLPDAPFLGTDTLTFALADGTATSSYELEIDVRRILACQVETDCGGGDLCVNGACVGTVEVTGRSGGGCSSVGGELAGVWGTLALALAGLRRRRR